jgi:dihydropteroate synthase
MGVLNVTPDSFSDGGRFLRAREAVSRALEMVEEGADLIDIGGESTRPGAAGVSLRTELRRVLPVVETLARRTAVPISVDTSKAEVARRALEAGASIVNDVTALRGDPEMAQVAARAKARVVLMHMRGSPRTMQRAPRYGDVVEDVARFLGQRIQAAQAGGIARGRLLIDPGLGFGKTSAHNLQLLCGLRRLARLGCPILVGPSRKSFIGRTLGVPVRERLPGTLACAAVAWLNGAAMVRVHDVKETVQFFRMWHALGREH